MSPKILLTIDGSEYSDMSIETIKSFHLPSQTEVTVMTVVPEHTFLGGITFHNLRKGIHSKDDIKRAKETKATETLNKPVEELRGSDMKVESIICHGKPAEKIIEQARTLPADLVVIGAKGISNSQRFRLGGTAYKIIRHANSSVLLVKEKTTKIRTVILATDGSKHSEAAVNLLLGMPLPKQSSIMIVTVLQSYMGKMANLVKSGLSDTESDENMLLSELRNAENEAAQKIIANTKKQFQESGYNTYSHVLRGDPAEEILTFANSRYPDLIVLGAKGLSKTDTFLIGSVAQRVTRLSRYSVMLVRSS